MQVVLAITFLHRVVRVAISPPVIESIEQYTDTASPTRVHRQAASGEGLAGVLASLNVVCEESVSVSEGESNNGLGRRTVALKAKYYTKIT